MSLPPRNLAQSFLRLLATPDLPSLGPDYRRSRQPADTLLYAVNEFSKQHNIPHHLEPCLRSAALLWHDHLQQSHSISQTIASPDGSLLHGIMHRREPDYANAAYWFRRTGNHPAYTAITGQLPQIPLSAESALLIQRLSPNNRWDPFAFINAIAEVTGAKAPSESMRVALQHIQRAEFECLISEWLSPLNQPA